MYEFKSKETQHSIATYKINQSGRPIIYHMKWMTLVIHRLKKTSMTVSSSQKMSEMQHATL